MPEFQGTMKQWRRMCKVYPCGKCPLIDICCPPPKSHTDAEIAMIEEVITNWAEEHPEPVEKQREDKCDGEEATDGLGT